MDRGASRMSPSTDRGASGTSPPTDRGASGTLVPTEHIRARAKIRGAFVNAPYGIPERVTGDAK